MLELAAAQDAMLRRSRQSGAPPEMLQHHARVAMFLREEARRRATPEAADWRPHLISASYLADLLVFDLQSPVDQSVRGKVAAITKRTLLTPLKPLYAEILRPQRAFNLELVGVISQLLAASPTRDATLAEWARKKLAPLNTPTGWMVKSHRGGRAGRAAEALKKKWLDTVAPTVGPVLDQQQRWNALIVGAADLITHWKPELLLRAHHELGALTNEGDLLKHANIDGLSLAPRTFWSQIFRRQESFNRAVQRALYVFFGLPTRAVDGRAEEYGAWLAEREPKEIEETRVRVKQLKKRPLISIVTAVHDTPEGALRTMLDSVLAQNYDRWELCAHDDGSTDPRIRAILADYARRDARIRFQLSAESEGVAIATNRALAMARGEFVAFLEHDDALLPHAVGQMVLAIDEEPNVDLLYSDEDRLDLKGHRTSPFFKPDWSPDLLRECNYIAHLLVVRKQLLDALGGVRAGVDGAQGYDLALRLTERTARIRHVPRVLYHSRTTPYVTAHKLVNAPDIATAAEKALKDHLNRCGEDATVESPVPTQYRVRYRIKGKPRASIVVAYFGTPASERCLNAILNQTEYGAYEIIAVGTAAPPKLDERVRFVECAASTNAWQRRVEGVRHATGKILVFIDDDLTVLNEDWLQELISLSNRSTVGAVSGLILHPDHTIEQAGWVCAGDNWLRPFENLPNLPQWTTMGSTYWRFNRVILPSALFAIRRDVFASACPKGDGDAENLTARLCLALREMNLSLIYTPDARVIRLPHSATPSRASLELGSVRDPFYNPNLSERVANGQFRSETSSPPPGSKTPSTRLAGSAKEGR